VYAHSYKDEDVAMFFKILKVSFIYYVLAFFILLHGIFRARTPVFL
jgi:hypothetical protein